MEIKILLDGNCPHIHTRTVSLSNTTKHTHNTNKHKHQQTNAHANTIQNHTAIQSNSWYRCADASFFLWKSKHDGNSELFLHCKHNNNSYKYTTPYITYQQIVKTTRRWMGEKFEGIRAAWNPIKRKLYLDILSIVLIIDSNSYL